MSCFCQQLPARIVKSSFQNEGKCNRRGGPRTKKSLLARFVDRRETITLTLKTIIIALISSVIYCMFYIFNISLNCFVDKMQ